MDPPKKHRPRLALTLPLQILWLQKHEEAHVENDNKYRENQAWKIIYDVIGPHLQGWATVMLNNTREAAVPEIRTLAEVLEREFRVEVHGMLFNKTV
jgi:hypothetical protein